MASVSEIFKETQWKKRALLNSLILLVLIISIFSLMVGSISISVHDVLLAIGHSILPNQISEPKYAAASVIIVKIRMPRILLAIIAGASLGIAGTVMQGTLRNPLVSPFTLGLSSAAAFGAAVSIVLGSSLFGAYDMSINIAGQVFHKTDVLRILMAFIFGMFSVVIIILMARNKRMSQSTLILSGVVISYLFQAGIMFLKYISDNDQLREVTSWLMGGLGIADWSTVLILAPIVLLSTYLMILCSVQFNTMSCGDEVAQNLGVDVNKLRRYSLLVVAFSVSACMSFTGVIGFIGLMAPHICRMIIGNDHRYLIPCSAVMGALILLASDTVGRVITAPEDMPVGVIMYMIGGAFFLYLVVKGKGKGIE